MKDREYVFTVEVRTAAGWERRQLAATSMVEVSRLTSTKLDDLRYITKERLR